MATLPIKHINVLYLKQICDLLLPIGIDIVYDSDRQVTSRYGVWEWATPVGSAAGEASLPLIHRASAPALTRR